MLNIQKVTAKGFLCYKDVEISFNKDTVTQIIGSNGAGKSSIPTILEEAFYSKNSKGLKKEELVNWDSKGYEINCYFEIDSAPYHLNVKRSSSLRVTLYAGTENISGHTSTQTYKILHELIQLDYNTFTKLVNQNLNSSLEFLTATDTNRKKFLVSLFDLSEYLEEEKKLKDKLKEVTNELKVVHASIEAHKKYAETKIPAKQSVLEEYEPNILDTTHISSQIVRIEMELDDLENANSKIKANNALKEKAKRIAGKPCVDNPFKQHDVSELESKYSDIKAELRQVEANLRDLQGLRSTCHACGSKLNNDEQILLRSKLEEERNTLSSNSNQIFQTLELLRNENTNYARQEKAIQEFKHSLALAESKIDWTLPDTETSVEDLEQSQKTLKSELKVIKEHNLAEQTKAEEIRLKNKAAEAHNTKVDILLEQQAEAKEALKDLYSKEATLTLEELDLKTLIKAFSTKGLVNFKIESMIKVLETTINDYLVHTSDGKFVIEFIADNDKLNVTVNHLGQKVSINSLSSGELQKVNIATLLAVRKLMSSFSKSHINILFFDEVVSTLDDEAKETLIELLMKEHTLNSFVVSHSWTHPLVAKLEVSKGNVTYIG